MIELRNVKKARTLSEPSLHVARLQPSVFSSITRLPGCKYYHIVRKLNIIVLRLLIREFQAITLNFTCRERTLQVMPAAHVSYSAIPQSSHAAIINAMSRE